MLTIDVLSLTPLSFLIQSVELFSKYAAVYEHVGCCISKSASLLVSKLVLLSVLKAIFSDLDVSLLSGTKNIQGMSRFASAMFSFSPLLEQTIGLSSWAITLLLYETTIFLNTFIHPSSMIRPLLYLVFIRNA